MHTIPNRPGTAGDFPNFSESANKNGTVPRPARILQIPAAMFPLGATGSASVVVAMFVLVAFAGTTRADIYRWEYINPADPSQGKQQSMMLAPDGAGADAGPGVNLDGRNLTMAYLIGADLQNASFYGAWLTNADFAGTEIRAANFAKYAKWFDGLLLYGSGITPTQLYSTASYQARDLSRANFGYNELAGGSFAGQNLADSNFEGATLTDADFSGAHVRGASFGSTRVSLAQLYSTASYQAHDLTGINLYGNDLSGGNFADQKLANANFSGATLTDADFTGAVVRGAAFTRPINVHGDGPPYNYIGTGITLAQLYSTASYQARDLSGIGLIGNDLTGGDFAGQDLTNAVLGGLAGVDLTAADARGAVLYPGVMATNLILPDGQIKGLDLEADGLLVVRDYDGNPIAYPAPTGPIPISVDQRLTMGAEGTLRMVFDADAWNSTISYTPGIPVTLGGTLELTFAADVNLASQVGRTFDLFDWSGVSPTGAFAVFSTYAWDLSALYTTGEVTLTAVPEPASIALAAATSVFVASRKRRARQLSPTLRTSNTLTGETS